MNEQLALRTLSNLLNWDQEAQDEFAWLRLMSKYKYDAYQGYEPGLRFFESLIGWLHQFEDVADRKTAYQFLKLRLMFFSRDEVAHLVHRLYPYVRETLSKAIAESYGIKPYEVWANTTTRAQFEICLRKTLFVGLSDGAMMDIFRRANEGRLSNEQIVVAHEISELKWKSMIEKLGDTIKNKKWSTDCSFDHVFLIDDFTASGTSLIDHKVDGSWGGKINKFIEGNQDYLDKGWLKSPCCLHVHHYLASGSAKKNIESLITKLHALHPSFKINLSFGHIIEDKFKVTKENDPAFYDLLTRHYDKEVQTEISKEVQYGYKGCALSVVLEHNTPNNTVSLIWAESSDIIATGGKSMKPLFRRRTRH
jgi:hypothetical protein